MKKAVLISILVLIPLASCLGIGHAFMGKIHTGNTIYASFGDCVAWGSIAKPKETNGYSALTAAFLNRLFPKTTLVNCGVIAADSNSYLNDLPPILAKLKELTKEYGPMERASLLIGTGDLQDNKDPHVDQVKASLAYKARLQKMIDEILKVNPSCELVLCTNFDQNNGGIGTMAPYPCPGLIKEFNKRIFELGRENHLPVADLYKVMMGHPDYYVPTDTHPNNAGHEVIASVLEEIFDPGHRPQPPVAEAAPPAEPRFETIYIGSKEDHQ